MRNKIIIGLGTIFIIISVLPLTNAAWSSRNLYHAMVNGYLDMEALPTRRVVSPRTGYETIGYRSNYLNQYAQNPYRFERTALNDITENRNIIPTQVVAVTEKPSTFKSNVTLKESPIAASEKFNDNVDLRNSLHYNFRIQPSVEHEYHNTDDEKVITDVNIGDQIDFMIDPMIAETWGSIRWDWEYKRDRLSCRKINSRHLTCLITDEYPSVVTIKVSLLDRNNVPHYSFHPDMIRIIPNITKKYITARRHQYN